ncbi:hypothetical protein ACEQ8H_006743 [Pleosporales sp. CAS-2024a]
MDRPHAFQRASHLKQPCIHVLSVTAALAQTPDSRKELVAALANLFDTLQAVASRPAALDHKLAEYVFVPISQVLRRSRQVPVRALELCLECISLLLRAAWGGALSPALSGQLLILFTFLAKPSSSENGIAATSEELQTLALKAMADLLAETSRTSTAKAAVTSASNIPALGEALLVMLDTLTDAKSNGTRLQAAATLKATILAIADDDALASFLPKTVSSLTKVLTPSSSNRPGFRVVQQSIQVLSLLLQRLLGDKNTQSLPKASADDMSSRATMRRTASWVQATAAQIKIALANIFKLRNHDKSQVRWALLQLCIGIIQDCRSSLSECTAMAIETAVSLAGREEDQEPIENELKKLLSVDKQLGDLLRESLHGWVVSLPRLMQSKDDQTRRQLIHRIAVTLRLFDRDVALIDERLADGLRHGISTVLADSKGLEELEMDKPVANDQVMLLRASEALEFEPLTLRLKGQEDMMVEFRSLLLALSQSKSASNVLSEFIRTLTAGSQETRLASFWAAVHLMKDMTTTNSILDDFIDMGPSDQRQELLDHLYSQSITILTQQDHGIDLSWHFYALALEVVALQASRYKVEYRPELTEVLYPVLHYLGVSNEALRQHALTCLNILATECGYADAGELVVANADYVVNAVGLKLAVGNVSPQAPQVLLMMMRLCGPSLLPYLDDLVGSIFDALERYHGYTRLTEMLFSVLKGMTEEGVKAPLLAITQDNDKTDNTHPSTRITMLDVITAIKRLDQQARKNKEEDDKYTNESFPHAPWKSDQSAPSRNEPQPSTTETDSSETPPPAPRTYDLLLRISSLTQHYLTTPSPQLRTSLLSLLRTTIPPLAKHENSFLPLINTLWPVLLPRLQDPEAYVVSNALDIIALMCENAGGFMRTRIEESWHLLRQTWKRTKQREDRRGGNKKGLLTGFETDMQHLSVSTYRPEMYVDTPTKMIWNSLVGLLCAIAEHVTIRDERLEEISQMLDPVLERADVKKSLDKGNADALWLLLYKKAKVAKGGVRIAKMKMPKERPGWHFVRV